MKLPPLPLDTLVAAILALAVCAAAFIDARSGRIPNKLVYCAVPLMLALHGVFGPSGALADSALGLGVTVAVFMVPYAMGWLGAGDVKLLGLVGAALGLNAMPSVVLFSSLIGGAYALWAAHRHLLVEEEGARRTTLFRYIFGTGPKPRVCYGVAIAVGTLSAMAWKELGQAYLFSLS